jgi:ABC-type lipoprotein export system ATPase subunit
MNLLRNQLCPPEASICEEDDYGIWNQVLPSAVKIDEPAELSPEELFRLASETIAKATDKSIIIAEEPTAHLSTELSLQLLQLLRKQATQGKCVLIASSNPQLRACANNVINLNQINL